MYAQHNTDQVKEILEEYRIGNLVGTLTLFERVDWRLRPSTLDPRPSRAHC